MESREQRLVSVLADIDKRLEGTSWDEVERVRDQAIRQAREVLEGPVVFLDDTECQYSTTQEEPDVEYRDVGTLSERSLTLAS